MPKHYEKWAPQEIQQEFPTFEAAMVRLAADSDPNPKAAFVLFWKTCDDPSEAATLINRLSTLRKRLKPRHVTDEAPNPNAAYCFLHLSGALALALSSKESVRSEHWVEVVEDGLRILRRLQIRGQKSDDPWSLPGVIEESFAAVASCVFLWNAQLTRSRGLYGEALDLCLQALQSEEQITYDTYETEFDGMNITKEAPTNSMLGKIWNLGAAEEEASNNFRLLSAASAKGWPWHEVAKTCLALAEVRSPTEVGATCDWNGAELWWPAFWGMAAGLAMQKMSPDAQAKSYN